MHLISRRFIIVLHLHPTSNGGFSSALKGLPLFPGKSCLCIFLSQWPQDHIRALPHYSVSGNIRGSVVSAGVSPRCFRPFCWQKCRLCFHLHRLFSSYTWRGIGLQGSFLCGRPPETPYSFLTNGMYSYSTYWRENKRPQCCGLMLITAFFPLLFWLLKLFFHLWNSFLHGSHEPLHGISSWAGMSSSWSQHLLFSSLRIIKHHFHYRQRGKFRQAEFYGKTRFFCGFFPFIPIFFFVHSSSPIYPHGYPQLSTICG